MKILRRIKLINWHLFSNQTIDIKGNCLLSGENGAGKSTFLDALQYVLTGGKAKFNTAANTNAKRDLEGYVRCKLGTENKTYLREDEVTSHIALEFFDKESLKSTIIGVIIEINKNGRLYEKFYVITNHFIEDDLYIDGDYIRGYADFKKYLTVNEIEFAFCDTKEQTRKMYLHALDIKNNKYIELIPKALAFRPIDELNKFVFEFLLNEKKVSIDDLRQNVRSYREFENLIQALKDKIESLTKIETTYEEFKKFQTEIELFETMISYVHVEILLEEKKGIEQVIQGIQDEMMLNRSKQGGFEASIIDVNSQIDHVLSMLNNDTNYRFIHDLDQKIVEKESKLKQLEHQLIDLREIYQNELNLVKYVYNNIKKDPSIQQLMHSGNLEHVNMVEFRKLIKQIKEIYEKIKDHYFYTLVELKNKKDHYDTELQEVNASIDQLEKNQFKFDYQVTKLKELIDEEITKVSQKDYQSKVLCELIDIKDETWRDAIEGYLNSQRFDLIVEPEYFDTALQVYEKHKLKERIYGVGLVNTLEIEKYSELVEHSLSDKIISNNKFARCYANMLLNRVVCVDDIRDLRKHKTAITRTCMVYNNYTARQIREEVYRQPFIGVEAVKIQLEKAKERKKNIESLRVECLKEITKIEFYLQRIKNHQLDYIHHHLHIIDDYNKQMNEVEQLHEQYKKYSIDPTYQNLQLECESLRLKVKELENNKKLLILEEGRLVSELENKKNNIIRVEHELVSSNSKKDELNHSHVSLIGRVEEQFALLCTTYRHDYQKLIKYSQERIKQNEELKNKASISIITLMNHYNTTYHFGGGAAVSNIKEYFDELCKIRQYELIQYEDKARESRTICEIAFKEQFIFKLRENILIAQEELDYLNEALKGKKFGGDEYEFIYKPNTNYNYQQYYKLIMSEEDYFTNTLFTESVSDQNKIIMKELFDKLVIDSTDEEAEQSLEKFTDYRNYMSYDIRIHHKNGESTLFSKVSREKSGGETQTPFYVVIAASFEQLISDKLKRTSPACFVMFDEAFNNMDESRIQAMMEFYSKLNIQLMIAVPPQRIETIIEHVNTTLVVIKDDEQSYIETFNTMGGLK